MTQRPFSRCHRTALPCAAAALAAGCATPAQPPPSALRTLTAFACDCDDGPCIVARHRAGTDDVWLFPAGISKPLPQVRAAPGAKYSDGGVTFWSKGRECQNTMSGERFPTTVTVRLNRDVLRGCGTALH